MGQEFAADRLGLAEMESVCRLIRFYNHSPFSPAYIPPLSLHDQQILMKTMLFIKKCLTLRNSKETIHKI